jgi:GNAT superfamily N-acetyltransferase
VDSRPVPAARLESLAPLFAAHRRLRVVIDSVLQGVAGRAWVEPEGRVARLDLGVYRVLGGEADAPGAAGLLAGLPLPGELVVDGSPAWDVRLGEELPGCLRRRAMRAFAGDGLEPDALRSLIEASPLGIVALDAGLAASLDAELPPNATGSFGGPAAFAARGLGFAALDAGRPVSAASSYALSRAGCEIAIGTHPRWRRRGLARAVAARLLLECRERGLEPHWNAANPTSSGLATALGLRSLGEAIVYDLRDPNRDRTLGVAPAPVDLA